MTLFRRLGARAPSLYLACQKRSWSCCRQIHPRETLLTAWFLRSFHNRRLVQDETSGTRSLPFSANTASSAEKPLPVSSAATWQNAANDIRLLRISTGLRKPPSQFLITGWGPEITRLENCLNGICPIGWDGLPNNDQTL